MNTVGLRYPRLPLLKWTKTVNACMPEKWGECTERHLRALLYSKSEGATDLRFISLFTGINERILRKVDKFCQFLIIEKIEAVAKSPFTGIFYIKTIECGKEKLIAPGDRMHGMTFGQFIFVDAYFNDNDPGSADKFISHLYLPKGEKFNEENCLARAKNLIIDEETKEAIMYNYGMFYGYLEIAYPLLFSSGKGDGTGKYDPRGWLKVYERVVGDDIVNSEQYANMPLHTMFRFLTDNIKKAARTRTTKPNG